jgi:hypothetical protein
MRWLVIIDPAQALAVSCGNGDGPSDSTTVEGRCVKCS